MTRKVVVKKGKVAIWDDLLLDPITAETACTLLGQIELEGGIDPSGITVSAGDQSVTTVDSNGHFTFDNLPPGEITVRAHTANYANLYTHVTLSPDKPTKCKLTGYLQRSAEVR